MHCFVSLQATASAKRGKVLQNLQKSFWTSGASKILSGVGDTYLVFWTDAGIVVWPHSTFGLCWQPGELEVIMKNIKSPNTSVLPSTKFAHLLEHSVVFLQSVKSSHYWCCIHSELWTRLFVFPITKVVKTMYHNNSIVYCMWVLNMWLTDNKVGFVQKGWFFVSKNLATAICLLFLTGMKRSPPILQHFQTLPVII